MLSPPILTHTKPHDSLFVYLAVAEEVVSAMLIRETEDGQSLIYFVSWALEGANTSAKVKACFQAHQSIYMTNPSCTRHHRENGNMDNRVVKSVCLSKNRDDGEERKEI
ncbi:hypothetical protein CR513_42989, partial [Mucuna pruriens]